MRGNDHECSLLEAGAFKAKALAGWDAANDVEIVFSVGEQNTEKQRRAVDAMIAAPNTGKALSNVRHVEPPDLTPSKVFDSWRRSGAHYTHGVLCRNTLRSKRLFAEAQLAQLTAADEEMAACLQPCGAKGRSRSGRCAVRGSRHIFRWTLRVPARPPRPWR
jgi:hypothetical protein